MTALYRAYRPQTFTDVIGQDSVVRTLRNAIETDRVAHAYLFTGSKGTGKTTMAKLLAKAMNCVNGPTVDPCGECESCLSIARGTSVDVAEIDAASNTGVQDVRDRIIDTVAYRPAAGARRVYILDEAHMLSPSAFNALLKTIEEPPAHVLFIFCTTETHKMMATVRDRCQRLVFAPPSRDDLVRALRHVADAEAIGADDATLATIARVAQGSFRNALGTLELMVAAYGSEFTTEHVLRHLGMFSEDALFDAAAAMGRGDAAAILTVIEQIAQEGADLEQFAYQLAELLRALLVTAAGVEPTTVVVADPSRLAAASAELDQARIIAAIDCLADAVARMRTGMDARLALETGCVRACQGLGLPALALRLARLEHGGGVKPGTPVAPAAVAVASAPPVAPPAAPAAAVAAPAAPAAPAPPVQAAPAAPEPAAATPAPASTPTAALADHAVWWPQLMHALADKGPLRAPLAHAQVVEVHDNRVTLGLPANMMPSLQGSGGAIVAEAIGTLTGTKVALSLTGLDAPADSDTPSPADAPAGVSAAPAAPAAPTAAPDEPVPAGVATGFDKLQATLNGVEVDA